MFLSAVKENLATISTRKKIFAVLFGILFLVLLLIAVEIIYCFNSEVCLLRLVRSYPPVGKLTGVKESELAFGRDKLIISKSTGVITVSDGEIIRLEKNRLTLRFEDGTEKSFSVEEGSIFIVNELSSELEISENEYVFNGFNLEEFLRPGYYLIFAPVERDQITSNYNVGRVEKIIPIRIGKELR